MITSEAEMDVIFVPYDGDSPALSAAYTEAAQQQGFVDLMKGRGFSMMNIPGDEAQAFLTNWQKNTAWLMQDAGLSKSSPEDFGIERP